MGALAFDPTGVKNHGLTDTTLSRTRTLDQLYLVKPLTMKNFKVK